jgi:hypothetical protein
MHFEPHERANWKIIETTLEERRQKPMQKTYEAPELTLVGDADEVVMGATGSGFDLPFENGWDFEFAQD